MTDRIDTKETTMTTYTAEDFAEASFARHPYSSLAVRAAYMSDRPWRATTGLWRTDADMANDGWVPVREAANQPITLDALQAAWEGAEPAEECGPGDVVIRPGAGGRYEVIPVEYGTQLTGMTRILHRAPKPKQPEGAEVLGALLDEWVSLPRGDEPTPSLADWLAERLTERGIRVTEEGEK